MFKNRFSAIAGFLVFLILAAIFLYRLIFWFPITIGNHSIGQAMSFFLFAAFGALAIISIQDLRKKE